MNSEGRLPGTYAHQTQLNTLRTMGFVRGGNEVFVRRALDERDGNVPNTVAYLIQHYGDTDPY